MVDGSRSIEDGLSQGLLASVVRQLASNVFRNWTYCLLTLTGLTVSQALLADVDGEQLHISKSEYAERLHGFWLGQSIANWTGLVTEMDRVEAPFLTDEDWGTLDEPAIWGLYTAHSSRRDFYLVDPERVWGADDDTDIEYIYWSLAEESEDPPLTPEQIREGWLSHIYSNEDAPLSSNEFRRENFLWVSNERAFELMQDGMLPPETSNPENNPDASMIDAQLTTESFGLMAPGMPAVALELAKLPISVTANGEAAAIARFYVVMHSLAIHLETEQPLGEQLVALAERASRELPAGGYSRDMFDFVLNAYRSNGDASDWESTRDAVYKRYQIDGAAGYQYERPFDAGINFAASLISLFYGEGDFKRTVQIASLAGWDSDNPAATWGGLLGFALGREGVEDVFSGTELSDLYWIHRTRKGFPDHTPDLPGEDRFSLMAEREVAVVERVILRYGNGSVTPDGQWVIPLSD